MPPPETPLDYTTMGSSSLNDFLLLHRRRPDLLVAVPAPVMPTPAGGVVPASAARPIFSDVVFKTIEILEAILFTYRDINVGLHQLMRGIHDNVPDWAPVLLQLVLVWLWWRQKGAAPADSAALQHAQHALRQTVGERPRKSKL